MPRLPRKPQRGDKVLQALYDSVCDIIDYLPSLEVRGDNKTTAVNHTEFGTTIRAVIPNVTINKTTKGEGGGGEEYYNGTGLSLINNVFSITLPNDNTKNYALVCLSGALQWVELDQCN